MTTTATALKLPTLAKALENLIAIPTSVFETHGVPAEYPFAIPEGSPQDLDEARSVLIQHHILKEFIDKNETENAVYHALIFMRHVTELNEALAEKSHAATTPDSPSSDA